MDFPARFFAPPSVRRGKTSGWGRVCNFFPHGRLCTRDCGCPGPPEGALQDRRSVLRRGKFQGERRLETARSVPHLRFLLSRNPLGAKRVFAAAFAPLNRACRNPQKRVCDHCQAARRRVTSPRGFPLDGKSVRVIFCVPAGGKIFSRGRFFSKDRLRKALGSLVSCRHVGLAGAESGNELTVPGASPRVENAGVPSSCQAA